MEKNMFLKSLYICPSHKILAENLWTTFCFLTYPKYGSPWRSRYFLYSHAWIQKPKKTGCSKKCCGWKNLHIYQYYLKPIIFAIFTKKKHEMLEFKMCVSSYELIKSHEVIYFWKWYYQNIDNLALVTLFYNPDLNFVVIYSSFQQQKIITQERDDMDTYGKLFQLKQNSYRYILKYILSWILCQYCRLRPKCLYARLTLRSLKKYFWQIILCQVQ